MANVVRYLPLSQNAPDRQNGVNCDRREQLAAVVDEASRLVRLSEPTRRDQRIDEFLVWAGLRSERSGQAVSDLDLFAEEIRRGRKRSLSALGKAVRAVLRTGDAIGVEPDLDPSVTGAAALWASATAPGERKAAVQGHTVSAIDADWAIGRGPVLEARALDIAAFLLGERDTPPRARRMKS